MKQCCQKTSFYRIAETFLISWHMRNERMWQSWKHVYDDLSNETKICIKRATIGWTIKYGYQKLYKEYDGTHDGKKSDRYATSVTIPFRKLPSATTITRKKKN
jgi:hypothetical protein